VSQHITCNRTAQLYSFEIQQKTEIHNKYKCKSLTKQIQHPKQLSYVF